MVTTFGQTTISVYQNILKSLKPSTRQRFVSLSFDFPPGEVEVEIVANESGLARERCISLVNLAARLRALKGIDLEEVVSTRLLVYCAILMEEGLDPFQAAQIALVEPLCDEADVKEGLLELIRATYG